MSNYERIENMLDYMDYIISQVDFDALSDNYDEENEDDDLLDEMNDFDALSDHHDDENEDDDEVLKYLKIRTHHAAAKDGADVESEMMCVICQSEFEHEENIGTLQCGHEYHTDCIKQWLLRKKDCPICRASVFP
ncbi:hypothetical protein HAX54_051968 [Datura stramonium]|uniref:RING-type E3 ubiquitin transferase n=1 Tax=Datura stramonium TaxID=4076 RepID=A0ABS8T052_DATST|nr:hypothetical protein [Datura stramonium]